MKNYVLVLLVFLVFGCKNEPKKVGSQGLKILCTTGMIADAAQNIAQNKAEIVALMGSGTDPHLYKASQGDLEKMRWADIIFYNGLHLEGKMVEVHEALKRTKTTVALGETIPKNLLIANDKFGSNYDPHIWFSLKNWRIVAQNITKTLVQKDPDNAAFYTKNLAAYTSQLDSLSQEIAQKIGTIPAQNRVLITSHDAFEYYGREFGVRVKGLQGVSTVAEYGLKDIVSLVNFIVAQKVKAVFVETSVSPRSIESVVQGCTEKGHKVIIGGTLYSDAMGAQGTPDGTYLGMLRHNTNALVAALR